MRSTWSFQNIRLPIKFAIAVTLLTVGLSLWASAYYQTLKIEEATIARQTTLERFRILVNEIRVNISDARLDEKSFVIDRDYTHVSAFQEDIGQANDAVAELHEYIRTDEQNQLVFELHDLFDDYNASVNSGYEAAIKVGLTPSSGHLLAMNNHLVDVDELWEWDYFNSSFPRYVSLAQQIRAFLARAGNFGSTMESDMELQRAIISGQIDIILAELRRKVDEFPQAQQTADEFSAMATTFASLVEQMDVRDQTFACLAAFCAIRTTESTSD